jgi:hypothetical protein
MQAAQVVGRDVAGVRDRADGADDRGGFLVRMTLADLSVQAYKPAWLWDNLPFFDPYVMPPRTDRKS